MANYIFEKASADIILVRYIQRLICPTCIKIKGNSVKLDYFGTVMVITILGSPILEEDLKQEKNY